MLCLVQMRPVLDWVVCKLSAPGEAEGGCGDATALRNSSVSSSEDERGAWSSTSCSRVHSHRTIDSHALENPGGLEAGPQIKRSPRSFSALVS
jgi:hypothetical protein